LKITVIYDNKNKEITYKSVQFILKEIHSNNINTIVNEFSITDDFDSCFCDCYSTCQYYCPHENEITNCIYLKILKKLSSSLNNSDLIILVSSSPKHNIGSNMYKVLESLSYKWLPHKVNNFMINKIALAISDTTSFASFSCANITLSRILRFWGINKNFIFSKSLSKYTAQDLTEKKYIRLTSELKKLSSEIVNIYRQTSAVIIPNFKVKKSHYIYINNTPIIKLPKTDCKYQIKKLPYRKIL